MTHINTRYRPRPAVTAREPQTDPRPDRRLATSPETPPAKRQQLMHPRPTVPSWRRAGQPGYPRPGDAVPPTPPPLPGRRGAPRVTPPPTHLPDKIHRAVAHHLWPTLVEWLPHQPNGVGKLSVSYPHLKTATDAAGKTLVMAAFEANRDGVALSLMEHDFTPLPGDKAPISVGPALRPCLQKLQRVTENVGAHFDALPTALQAQALLWALYDSPRHIQQCVDSAVLTHTAFPAGTEQSVFQEVVRSPEVVKLLRLSNFGLWSACAWEKLPFEHVEAAALRDCGLHPILLARYEANRVFLNDAKPGPIPRGCQAKLAWVRGQIYKKGTTYVNAERDADAIPKMLRDIFGGVVWRRHFYVRFHKENGGDCGGLTNDWLTTTARRLYSADRGLFAPCEHNEALTVFHPNATKAAPEPDYRFAGRLLAKAIITGVPLRLKLPMFLLKQLTGRAVGMADLRAFDQGAARSLQDVLDSHDVEGMALSYEPLNSAAKDVPVTAANRHDYVALHVAQRLATQSYKALAAWAAGIYDVIPAPFLARFTPEELDTLIAGELQLDVQAWRDKTDVLGTSAHRARTAEFFWQLMGELPVAQRSKVFEFATGMSGPPAGGFAQLKRRFQLQIDDGNTPDHLPVGRTCFSKIEMPAYASIDIMRSKIKLLLTLCPSFGLA